MQLVHLQCVDVVRVMTQGLRELSLLVLQSRSEGQQQQPLSLKFSEIDTALHIFQRLLSIDRMVSVTDGK